MTTKALFDRIVLPRAEAPRASIIVLGWRGAPHLATCLAVLARTVGPAVPYEVIVFLNEPDRALESWAGRVLEGATVLSSEVNLGFGGGCNRAAAVARGENLVFLNDDAVVEPGWLETLVQAADDHPGAGAVGSRFLFPDGTLQEAGSVVWSDGTTAPVGRGLPPDSTAYLFLRDVDYCSGGSLLVRRRVFEDVGGFDEGYFPAYYEDVDLCLGIRSRGLRVLYEPRSRVRHHESSSLHTGLKSFLFTRNVHLLREKWADVLAEKEPPDPASGAAISRAIFRARGYPTRVLVLDDRIPQPGLGSGFPRMLGAIRELVDAGYAVSFYPSDTPEGDPEPLGRLGVEIVECSIDDHLKRGDVLYDAVVVSRPHNFDLFAEIIRARQPIARLIYDAEALFWRRLEGQSFLAMDPTARARLASEASEMHILEDRIPLEADRIVAISRDEADIMSGAELHCPIDVVEPLQPHIEPTTASFAERRDMVFVAGWLAGPDSANADGLLWFANQVLPLIRERIPWARLRVTGADPPDNVLHLAGPSLSFVGHVPDLREIYGSARLVVVPQRYGSGVKIKTVEALQYGVPVLTTTIGAEGVNLRDADPLEVADAPASFAARASELLGRPSVWEAKRREILELHETWERREVGSTTTWSGVIRAALAERPRAFSAPAGRA